MDTPLNVSVSLSTNVNIYLLEHAGLLQVRVTVVDPGQGLPPLAGLGLLHCLVLVCLPLPHVPEHDDHAPHLFQRPFTMNKTESLKLSNFS